MGANFTPEVELWRSLRTRVRTW